MARVPVRVRVVVPKNRKLTCNKMGTGKSSPKARDSLGYFKPAIFKGILNKEEDPVFLGIEMLAFFCWFYKLALH